MNEAQYIAEIIDGRITAFHAFLTGISRMPIIQDVTSSYQERTNILINETKAYPNIQRLYFVDISGMQYNTDGAAKSYANDVWFKESIKGKNYATEPYTDPTRNNELFITFSIPVYDNNKKILGVLCADVNGLWLSEQIKDIKIGKTGFCTIIGLSGVTLAHKNPDLVKHHVNLIEEAKKNAGLAALARFLQTALSDQASTIGLFEFNGIKEIGAYSKT